MINVFTKKKKIMDVLNHAPNTSYQLETKDEMLPNLANTKIILCVRLENANN